jgi:hypothetical protein
MTDDDENADDRTDTSDQPTAADESTVDRAVDQTRDADRPLVRGLTTAVGTFVVFGVGLVFTSFFATQFAGTEGVGGGAVTTGSGFGFAVLLSPLLAVLLGVVLGRDDASPVDAAAASAAGFVAMYFVTVVVASSLYSPSAGNLGIGPFAGYTVGVALTGGAAAAVPDRDLPASVGDISVGRPALFGAAAIAVYAGGFAVSTVVADALAGPTDGGTAPVFTELGAEFALVVGTLAVPAAGVFAGYLTAPADADDRTAAVGGAAAGAVGGAVAVVAFYLATTIVSSGGSFPLGRVVGVAVGTALTTAGAAVVAVRD